MDVLVTLNQQQCQANQVEVFRRWADDQRVTILVYDTSHGACEPQQGHNKQSESLLRVPGEIQRPLVKKTKDPR